MTLLFLDGCDHWDSAAALSKWSSYSGPSLIPGAGGGGTGPSGRNGKGIGIRAGGAGNVAWLKKIVLPSQEHATFIVGFALQAAPNLPTVVRRLLSCNSDGGVTEHVSLCLTAGGQLQVRRGDQSGTILGTETGVSFPVANTWHYVAMKVLLSDTVGTVEVRLDGRATPVIALSGQDTKNAGTKTGFDGIQFGDTGTSIDIDDIYLCNGAGSVNNDFLGDIRVDTLLPNGDGSNSGMSLSTGTTHSTLVDENPQNTTDYVFSATAGTKDTWNYANTVTVGTVRGVQLNTYAQKSDASARSFRPVVRHAGTDYGGTDVNLGVGFVYYQQVYETNPGTGVAWTTANVDAAEFGVEVRP